MWKENWRKVFEDWAKLRGMKGVLGPRSASVLVWVKGRRVVRDSIKGPLVVPAWGPRSHVKDSLLWMLATTLLIVWRRLRGQGSQHPPFFFFFPLPNRKTFLKLLSLESVAKTRKSFVLLSTLISWQPPVFISFSQALASHGLRTHETHIQQYFTFLEHV